MNTLVAASRIALRDRALTALCVIALAIAIACPRGASAAGAATTFAVQGLPAAAVAGAAASFTIVALDSTGATASGFVGTVAFTSNDSNATVPANYTFLASDAGVHAFQFTPRTAGSIWIQAQSGSVYGSGATTVSGGSPANFTFTSYSGSANVGVPSPASVTAYDTWWNQTNYSGTAVFSSSDPSAALPVAPAFTNGVANVSITFANGGSRSVTVVDSGRSTMTDTFWTNVAAGPSATITAPANVTTGASATASVSSQSGVTYAWTISGGAITAGAGTNSVTFTAGATGTLTLSCVVTNTTTHASSTGNANVPVAAAPSTPVITAASPVQASQTGRTATVTAHSGMTYSWTISGATITSSAAGVTSGSTNTMTYTAGAVGTITITCTEINAAGTRSSAASASVTAIAAPAKPTIVATSPVTSGATGLTATVTAKAGMTYAWTITGGTITSSSAGVTSGTTNTMTYTAGAIGTATLTCTESNGVTTSAAATKSVSVIAAPKQPAITTVTAATAGQTGIAASVTANTGMHYAWTITGGTITSSGGTAGVTSGGKNTLTFTAGSAGTLSLTVAELNAANASSAPASAAITVTAAGTPVTPVVTTITPVTANAAGLTASVTARSGFTYAWTVNGGTITSAGGAAGVTGGGKNTITYSGGAVGTLVLTAAESNGTTSSTAATATVNVIAAPVTPTVTTSASTALSGTTSLTASVTANAGMTYSWTISGGTITSNGGPTGVTSGGVNTVTFTAGAAGTLTVSCVEVNAAQTASAAGSATIAVQPAPPSTPTITVAGAVTAGVQGLTASVVAHSGMTYTWTASNAAITSAGGSAGVTGSGKDTITFTAGSAGAITFTAVESNGTTSSSPGTATVTVVAAPVTPTITTPANVTAGQTNVGATVTANAGMTYLWTISGGTLTNPGGAAGTIAGGVDSIAYTAGSSATIVITCKEVNALGSASAAATVTVADQLSLTPSGTLYVVAHQDDDTLFFDPDIVNNLKSGTPTTLIWVTAGSSDQGAAAWQARENQSRDYIAGNLGYTVPGPWTCASNTYGSGQRVRVCTLPATPGITAIYLRLPDGSLSSLWATDNGAPFYVTPAATVTTADSSSIYTRADVINVLTQLIGTYSPATLSTMDSTFAYGDDHTDHQSSALFALMAARTYGRPLQTLIYRGYSVDGASYYPRPVPEAANLNSAGISVKSNSLASYYGLSCDPTGFGLFCPRRYAVSRLQSGTGPLESASGCLDIGGGVDAPGAAAVVGACTGSQTQRWTLAANGLITTAGGSCLDAAGNGTAAVLAACNNGLSQSWVLFSNGQLRGQNDACLTVSGASTSLQLCDANTSSTLWQPLDSQRWVLGAGPATTWSATGTFTDAEVVAASAYSGSLRLADVNGDGYADACIRFGDGIHCALNQGNGSFAPHTLWSAAFSDANGWSPDMYGSTLMLADLNGDGRADVCGRSASGLVCALAQPGGGFGDATMWTGDFSDVQHYDSATYYGSLHLADINGDGYADVCGRSSAGVVCALNTKAGSFAASSNWLSTDFTDAAGWQPVRYGSTLMFADINGDGRADVCGRGPAGVRCALAGAGVFVDARVWSFRTDFNDTWGSTPGKWGSLRLVDIDGDGRADLCGRGATGIVCAVSNGGGFDGAHLITPGAFSDATGFSDDAHGNSLVFGDVDKDGRADICARSPSGLLCSTGPGGTPKTP